MSGRVMLAASLVASVLAAGPAAAANATVTGPVRQGARPNAFHASVDDLKARGYVEE